MANGETVAASRQDFFATSDVVSIHVRLKPETQHIITAADFAAMLGDALFMNTSRAGLIAPGALLDALNNGHPGKAAIDVFDTEPITTADDPFVMHLHVVATPHIGFVAEDEIEIQFSDIFDRLVTWQAEEPFHMVNPQVWP